MKHNSNIQENQTVCLETNKEIDRSINPIFKNNYNHKSNQFSSVLP